MTNIWFTADPHIGHVGILKSCDRPFENVDSMNNFIITQWNDVVGKNDDIYVLGDFIWYKRDIKTVCKQLNGKIHLIVGNHDEPNLSTYRKMSNIVEVERYKIFKWNKKKYTLCHYPMMTWLSRRSGKGYHLFGHVHRTMARVHEGSMNVGMDMWNFTPLHIDAVNEHLERDKLIKL